jgi:hypothetical protein
MSKAHAWCQKSKVWATYIKGLGSMSKAWTWCKKLETPCHNELEENWGDEDGENYFWFF